MDLPTDLNDETLRQRLTPHQYQVLREKGTERPGSSPLNFEKRDGLFHCAACGTALFRSDTKYESGSGWPSFFAPIEGAVENRVDNAHGMQRVEVVCANCHSHLGHVFPDGPRPTGDRYCMNGLSLAFQPSGGPPAGG